MTPRELESSLRFLGLMQTEAAAFLRVTPNTVSRWLRHNGIPGPVGCTIQAWCSMKSNGLPWRPGAIPLTHLSVDDIVQRVKARGGAASPWAVDHNRGIATLGPLLISFAHKPPATAVPLSYERSDAKPDLERDRVLIEDGICRIAIHVSR